MKGYHVQPGMIVRCRASMYKSNIGRLGRVIRCYTYAGRIDMNGTWEVECIDGPGWERANGVHHKLRWLNPALFDLIRPDQEDLA